MDLNQMGVDLDDYTANWTSLRQLFARNAAIRTTYIEDNFAKNVADAANRKIAEYVVQHANPTSEDIKAFGDKIGDEQVRTTVKHHLAWALLRAQETVGAPKPI